VTESLLLAALGGVGGVTIGIATTTVYALNKHWPALVPAWASIAAVVITMLTGAVAGLYPAVRASRIPPTEALQ
jgi:putative ABC transport system permease protein